MATFTWAELIDRAKTYADDDHNAQSGWIKDPKWLSIGYAEYLKLRKKWIRLGLISPVATDVTFTTATTNITNVAILIGVAEDLGGGHYRMIPSGQAEHGQAPFWSTHLGASHAAAFEAHGEADDLTISLKPGNDAAGTYVVRYITNPTRPTLVTQSVTVPDGCDERLVLGMVRRAHLKDSGASVLLEKLIREEDEQIGFDAFGRLNSEAPRARFTRRTNRFSTGFPTDPRLWRY